MASSRRSALVNLLASAAVLANGQTQQNDRAVPIPANPNEDVKLPNGKSQKDLIAKQEYKQALKDVDELINVAEQLRDEIERSGEHVVSVASVKKTEDIEKLARKIRGRLKA
jgi:hypothetical protein